MTPILGLRQALGRSGALRQSRSSVCMFCSLTKRAGPSSLVAWRKSLNIGSLRRESTDAASTTTTTTTSDPRRDLQDALLDLQSQAPNHVNLARVQLALRNLSQPPGHESIRVALLGLKNGTNSGPTAKKLLKLALADPLNPPADWETQLEDHDLSQPLIVRVGAIDGKDEQIEEKLSVAKGHSIPEIMVSSPPLNAGNLEMLLMEAAELAAAENTGDALAVDDAILAPTVEISVPPKGTPTPIATPVHMALLVGDGVLGAASVLSIPILEGTDTIAVAVNFRKIDEGDLSGCPIVKVSLEAGEEGLELFREDVGNAMRYQALWSESNMGRIGDWLKENVLPNDSEATKAPVRNLIQSLLQNARAKIQADEARDLFKAVAGDIPPDAVARLNQGLSEWAQNAHEELQERLEVAFAGRSWRKLGWWKLFWRADDVGMLSSEMLALRFLPDAEKSIIYLAGRVQEAGVAAGHPVQPLYSSPPPATTSTAVATQLEIKWPTHISFTRNYLQEKTVPALQALAQKLVLQSTGGAALTTALAGLAYLSAFGAYESGAVAALGLVWSLRRLQLKWEAARNFWEEEVREEGRKAIRATEASIAEVLDRASKSHGGEAEALEELRKAREIIQRAEDALSRLP
ncbi:hypothetical protein QBC34DRAFT_396204 [Podospora aff. communis PSN243]|uniref:Mmc1 C-terminal domain-containing protein n=1 Tax=Podospora aff. communis PSN243 TaxID=3040156 RepID=A0AAV9GWL3_9PEZI|nr:hypothetical protein QBC34DRAFT_396204 [Podospora aff. communis PSN243]